MKRKALLSLIVTISVVLSMFGTVLAADKDEGIINSDGGSYKWVYDDYNNYLNISGTSTSHAVKSYTEHNSDIKYIYLENLLSSNGYSFSGFEYGLNDVYKIYTNGKCNKLKIGDKCPTLELLQFYNNTSNWTQIDLTGTTNTNFPRVSIVDSENNSTEYSLVYKDFKGASIITVPRGYGENDYLYYTFADSSKLTSVTFEGGTNWIPERAFAGCKNITAVSIPAGVSTIEYSAFRNCTSLTSVTLPKSIKTLRFNAFTGSGVEEINYGGTRQTWYGLVQQFEDDGPVAGGNVLHLDYCVVHCSDGDILIRKVKGADNNYEYIQNAYGWIKENGSWYYYNENGGCNCNCITEINGKKYGFKSDCTMASGWMKYKNDWYFFDRLSGAMCTGWLNDSGKWYYLDSDGIMATGWLKDDGKWYYLNPDSGVMATGWVKDGGKWYFFKADGSMAANEYCDGYWLNSDGTWTYEYRASWRGNDSDGWWYGDSSGWYAKNQTLKIDGKNYSFNGSGYWVKG